MATVTTNFNFPIPQSTDLVKDGATAIAALGTAIDTDFVDLKGGTTGQVLAKASGTDLDFTWVAQDDSNAIQNAIVDAKGDLIAATAADTPARLAVGTNGQVLTADSTASTGLAWATPSVGSVYVAGKNFVINGNFDIWQRGTSFASTTGYFADRWTNIGDLSGVTASQQTSGAPDGSRYFLRLTSTAGSSYWSSYQFMETSVVAPMWGKTVTFSAKVRRNSTMTAGINIFVQKSATVDAGSGASWTTVGTLAVANASMPTGTTSADWYSASSTISIPNDGTANSLRYVINYAAGAASGSVLDIAQVMLEIGSTATTFARNGSTIATELAACQRYYEKSYTQSDNPGTATQAGAKMHPLVGSNVTSYLLHFGSYKVEKRATPSITIYDFAGNSGKVTVMNNSTTANTDNITGYVDTISSSSFRIYETGTSCGGYQYHYTASAEL